MDPLNPRVDGNVLKGAQRDFDNAHRQVRSYVRRVFDQHEGPDPTRIANDDDDEFEGGQFDESQDQVRGLQSDSDSESGEDAAEGTRGDVVVPESDDEHYPRTAMGKETDKQIDSIINLIEAMSVKLDTLQVQVQAIRGMTDTHAYHINGSDVNERIDGLQDKQGELTGEIQRVSNELEEFLHKIHAITAIQDDDLSGDEVEV
jgi:hypothetical protein